MKNAIIAAIVAAVVASGTTYAATTINGKMIRNHSVAAKKLTRQAVHSLRGRRGPAGPRGLAGLIDLSKLSVVDSGEKTIAPGTTSSVTASCQSGDKVTGGGFVLAHGNSDLVDSYGSQPNSTLTAWTTAVDNKSTANATVRAYAVCVSG